MSEIYGDFLNLPASMASFVSGAKEQQYQHNLDRMNREMQYDFAQNSIKWRVADAKQAGIHPLAALGVSPSSASPIYSSANAPSMRAFGELFRAQIDLVKSEADKNKAEALAINDQYGVSADVSAPGAPANKTNNATIISQGISNKKDVSDVLKETRQDSLRPLVYDGIKNMHDGSVPSDHELDAILSVSSGMAHYVPKGKTAWKQGMHLSDVIFNGINSLSNWAKTQMNKSAMSPETRKKIEKIWEIYDLDN